MGLTLGERIKQLRLEMNLTQAQLAERLNVDRSTISTYECGSRTIPVHHIIPLSKIFHVSADYLLGNSLYRNLDDLYLNSNEIEELVKNHEKEKVY